MRYIKTRSNEVITVRLPLLMEFYVKTSEFYLHHWKPSPILPSESNCAKIESTSFVCLKLSAWFISERSLLLTIRLWKAKAVQWQFNRWEKYKAMYHCNHQVVITWWFIWNYDKLCWVTNILCNGKAIILVVKTHRCQCFAPLVKTKNHVPHVK